MPPRVVHIMVLAPALGSPAMAEQVDESPVVIDPDEARHSMNGQQASFLTLPTCSERQKDDEHVQTGCSC